MDSSAYDERLTAADEGNKGTTCASSCPSWPLVNTQLYKIFTTSACKFPLISETAIKEFICIVQVCRIDATKESI